MASLHYTISVTFVLFFKQNTAYEMRISDWSSDVCSSDLGHRHSRSARDEQGPGRWCLHRHHHADAARSLRLGRINDGWVHKRSEERRVGKECVGTCGSRWSPHH